MCMIKQLQCHLHHFQSRFSLRLQSCVKFRTRSLPQRSVNTLLSQHSRETSRPTAKHWRAMLRIAVDDESAQYTPASSVFSVSQFAITACITVLMACPSSSHIRCLQYSNTLAKQPRTRQYDTRYSIKVHHQRQRLIDADIRRRRKRKGRLAGSTHAASTSADADNR